MGGVASVVEAGAITAMVALFTGVFVYRTIKWKDCTGAFRRAFRNSAMVFIIIAASGPFSWLLTSLGAIGDLEQWLLSLTESPIIFILAVILFIFLLGTVMDSAVNIIIVGPVLVNVMAQAGFPEGTSCYRCNSWLLNWFGNSTCWRCLLYCCNNSTSSFRKSGYCINSLFSRAIFTFIFYSCYSGVDYVSSKPIE